MTRKAFHHASEAVRRHDLIAATLDCIAEYGLQGATVRQIATQAGVTGGLIRHYFSSKELLFQAAYRQLVDKMAVTAIRKSDEAGDDPGERLSSFIAANFSEAVIDPKMLSLWATFIGQLHQDEALAAIHREGYLEFRRRLEELLAAFLKARKAPVAPDRLRAMAIGVTGVIDGLWLEGSMANELFEEGELAAIALSSAERIIGLPLTRTPLATLKQG